MDRNRSPQDRQGHLSTYEGVKGPQFSMLASTPILQPPLWLHCHEKDPTPKHRQGRQINVGKRFASVLEERGLL